VLSISFGRSVWRESRRHRPAAQLTSQSFTIIGVTPPAFTGTLQVDYRPAVTVPFAASCCCGRRQQLGTANQPGVWWINLMGRLKRARPTNRRATRGTMRFQAAALESCRRDVKQVNLHRLDPKTIRADRRIRQPWNAGHAQRVFNHHLWTIHTWWRSCC